MVNINGLDAVSGLDGLNIFLGREIRIFQCWSAPRFHVVSYVIKSWDSDWQILVSGKQKKKHKIGRYLVMVEEFQG